MDKGPNLKGRKGQRGSDATIRRIRQIRSGRAVDAGEGRLPRGNLRSRVRASLAACQVARTVAFGEPTSGSARAIDLNSGGVHGAGPLAQVIVGEARTIERLPPPRT